LHLLPRSGSNHSPHATVKCPNFGPASARAAQGAVPTRTASELRRFYPSGITAVFPQAHHRLRVIFGIALALFCVLFTAKWGYPTVTDLLMGNIWANDFFTIWSSAKFVISQPINQIYDNQVVHHFQIELGEIPTTYRPFVHPPSFLIFIIPLGFLPYEAAFVGWSVFTFLTYFIASYCRQMAGTAAFLAVFAPATIVNLAFGQTGFLSAALIVGGFRLVSTRPVLSGTLFGLASVKPHLGILVPVALIAARRWSTFAAAGGTMAILVIASGVAFGWSMWPLWLAKLFSHADWVADVKGRLNPTVTASLMFLGVNPTAARIVELCVATAVATIIWMCFRRGVTILATAALLVGTFLATPYAVVYDLPMVTSAVIAVLAEKSRTGTSLTILEAAVLSLALALPIIVMETWRLSAMKSIPLILLFGMIGWLIFHSNPAGSRAALSG
jgi:alpha-1,2-mannosyltransferase